MRRLMARAGVILLLAGLLPALAAPTATYADGPSTITTDYRKDPGLGADQKKALSKLAGASATPLRAEGWPRAGTVGRLELSVPSGQPASASLAAHALSFIDKAPQLWKLNSSKQLTVTGVVDSGDCSTVTLGTKPDGVHLVLNAAITVVLTPGGTIRGAAGHLSGEPIGEIASGRTSAPAATKILREYLTARGATDAAAGELPSPAEVVVDPYYLTGDGHAPALGWMYSATGGGTTGPGGGLHIVNEQTATVTLAGPGASRPDMTVAGCPGDNPVHWLAPVVLDPMTNTPAFIDLRPLNLTPGGANPTEAAYNLLQNPAMAGFYGDADPRGHLRDAREIPDVGGRTSVRFTEYYGGYPVEGGRLTVTLQANGVAEAVTGRFVFFPHPRLDGAMTGPTALSAATSYYLNLSCGNDSACRTAATAENAATPPAATPVIASAELLTGTALAPDEERLVYRIAFPRRLVYWDARSGGEVLGYATTENAIPHTISNAEQNNQVEIINGAPVPGLTPAADSTNVALDLSTIDTTLTSWGRNGFDGAGGAITVLDRDHTDETNAGWCPAGALQFCGGFRMVLGAKVASNDVVGHEFTHGIIEMTTGFAGTGEPAALNESYADTIGNAIFPDTNQREWKVGEDSVAGAIRDMADPTTFGDPGHYGSMTAVCGDPLFCSHAWAGVTNRAAVLVAQGGVPGSSHPGIGRDNLGQLWLSALAKGGSSDLFLDQRLNVWNTCREAVGSPINGRTYTSADCDHIGRAFDTVGVMAPLELGWTRFFGSADFDVTIHAGQSLVNGCTMADQILRGEDPSGEKRTSTVANGLTINMNDEWGATVTVRGAAANANDRRVTYHVWTRWEQTGIVAVDEIYAKPANTTDQQCRNPFGDFPTTVLWSTATAGHFSTFLDGAKGDTTLNAGVALPAGCRVGGILGQNYVHGHPDGIPVPLNATGENGFEVTRPSVPPNVLDASVHWWHSGISAVRVGVAYEMLAPPGVNCIVPGVLQPAP